MGWAWKWGDGEEESSAASFIKRRAEDDIVVGISWCFLFIGMYETVWRVVIFCFLFEC